MNSPLSSARDVRLAIVRDLTAALAEADVAYCHWKSNERLDVAVSGRTDLDILFDPQNSEQAASALEQAGFIRFNTAWYGRYPGIVDYVGIDSEAGRIVHVHAHFLLVVGETGLKSYHLAMEPEVLARREWDEVHRIYRSDAGSELLLLLVREALKLNRRAQLRLSKPNRKPSGAERELRWLKQRVSADQLQALARPLLGADGAAAAGVIYADGFTAENLVELKRVVTARLRGNRRFTALGARLALYARQFAARTVRRMRQLGARGLRYRRTLAGEGLIVAFVGPDGAGKSTVSAAVVKELTRKVEAEQVYMGSGKGSSGLLRYALDRLRFRKFGGPFRTMWCMALAVEKSRRLRRIARWRRKGKIVVSDRYPQADVEGYNDGPLLGSLKESRVPPLRAIARWERRCYERASIDAPDIAFRMSIDLEGLARRRPGMKVTTIERKRLGIERVRFPARTRVVDLNSEQPLELVIRDAMAEIGRFLRERRDTERAAARS